MNIRPDFAAVAPLLQKLAGLGAHFDELDIQTWSHLKNQEDFDRIFDLPDKVRYELESLYADGREMAGAMADMLPSFNEVGRYPFLLDFIARLERSWVSEVADHEAELERYREIAKAHKTPWAIQQMIALYQEQLTMLKSVQTVMRRLKDSDLYRSEAGEPMEKVRPQVVNIGVVGNVTGKVNVSSTDSSTTIHMDNTVFASIRESLSAADIPTAELQRVLVRLDAMEKEVGKPKFVQCYSEFMSAAANHVSVIAPFIPQLSALLS